MSTVRPVPADYPHEIVGYAQPWIVNPGDSINVKISCTEPAYTYRVVRFIQGHEGQHFPPKREEELEGIEPGTLDGRFQVANPGSYAVVDKGVFADSEDIADKVHVSLYFQPHLPLAGHPQCIVSTLDNATKAGFSVSVNSKGEIDLVIGTGLELEIVSTGFHPTRKQWIKLGLLVEEGSDLIELELLPLPSFVEKSAQLPLKLATHRLRHAFKDSKSSPLLFAASESTDKTETPLKVCNFFNGRIAHPTFSCYTINGGWRTIGQYDFAKGIESDTVFDVSGCERHGRLINAPTRAVTDHTWDGTEVDWTKASYGYGAIHFHEDDLDDAGWETDFCIHIPANVRSGAYSVSVEAVNGLARDEAVFFVRPSPTTTATMGAKTAFVLSTFTYLAYANERMYDESKASALKHPSEDFAIRKDWHFERMARRTDLGLSLYDVHRDGSGVVYSSPRRPLLNLRPDYIHWALQRPREFSADLLMIGFLEHLGIPYDVITDHDLHFSKVEGVAMDDSQYDVIITGCHPEYPTLQSWDAYMSYLKHGGSLMYLGGNGFYWAAALQTVAGFEGSNAFQGRLEIRRGDQGIRTYTMPGGERHLSVNGQRGTLWRSRGRPANVLVGVGSAGEGLGLGVPYLRTEASRSSKYSWMFEGLTSELIGVEGFGGGASGDEFDKYDVENGSPASAVVLATSTDHSDEFGIFIEDVGFPIKNTMGSQTREVRSDMVCYEAVGGGHVFSASSINWLSCVGWEAYDNDAARLTANVLRGFLNHHGHK
ncbi:hypothetical protein LTR10_017815 [Elasticomyces elasticus]|uniref:N,N-dimethylformamidase beta subunit-like C-terminal domain-containing protein n=1 Tax=Exophiala sideris TaxID=1016849 RepID=A0ABR0J2B0_9EURO|nr:hypothetical protein LTR10_017815 [Elasticomyces elasticus]KAK5023814.1 hypothetical protein LTS07_008939 [Exophiala sideris]KAK5030167.1 hypothetical protein LTR13_008480 [Exophiala sideris]KAK5053662.1 hypothetical protein LTR69_009307 [Exophiala sideris]KAK5179295.1 hypothetical protein LTR44_008133 [Eurotiomycetes sp. CCFEE 6388]